MLGHKTSLNKLKKTEIISRIFSDIMVWNYKSIIRGKKEKHTETRRLNNMLLNNEWVNNEIKEEIKRYLETDENKTQKSKICGTVGKQS